MESRVLYSWQPRGLGRRRRAWHPGTTTGRELQDHSGEGRPGADGAHHGRRRFRHQGEHVARSGQPPVRGLPPSEARGLHGRSDERASAGSRRTRGAVHRARLGALPRRGRPGAVGVTARRSFPRGTHRHRSARVSASSASIRPASRNAACARELRRRPHGALAVLPRQLGRDTPQNTGHPLQPAFAVLGIRSVAYSPQVDGAAHGGGQSLKRRYCFVPITGPSPMTKYPAGGALL